MQLSATLKAPMSLQTRSALVAALLLLLSAAVAIAFYSRPQLGNAVREAANAGFNNVKTVAAMLADRSPGERPAGALASLKQKRQQALHERALPKVRQPASPLAALVGTPPNPPIVPVETTPPPLYSMVAGAPVAVPPTEIVPGVSGGPPVSDIPPPGGGGGGIVVPPTVQQTPNTPVTPVTPVTPAVPEPATWAMMLLGFALIGWAIRRGKLEAATATIG
jgi:hypothetical protein